MSSIIDSVSKDRSNNIYPTALAVSSGVINGMQVNDAYMTTTQGMNQIVVPLLKSKGYYQQSTTPQEPSQSQPKKKQYEPEMSFADMKAMMDKFGR